MMSVHQLVRKPPSYTDFDSTSLPMGGFGEENVYRRMQHHHRRSRNQWKSTETWAFEAQYEIRVSYSA